MSWIVGRAWKTPSKPRMLFFEITNGRISQILRYVEDEDCEPVIDTVSKEQFQNECRLYGDFTLFCSQELENIAERYAEHYTIFGNLAPHVHRAAEL